MVRFGFALLALAAVWALWWPAAASLEKRATLDWLDAQRDAGWQADASDVTVSGFPLAYTRTVDQPLLADPAGGWAWQGDTLQLSRARHPRLSDAGTTLVLPPAQSIRTPWQAMTVTSQEATVVLHQGPDGDTLSEATLGLTGLSLTSDAGWDATVQSVSMTALAGEADPATVRVMLSAEAIKPPSRVAQALSRADVAPAGIERVQAEADVTFDQPWTMTALETARPQPTRIALRDAGVQWGELTLRVAGTLDVDASGEVSGDLLVKATNWREILAAAVASGAIPERVGTGIEGALDLMGRLAGSRQTLDIPVTFTNGRTRVGPLRVGPAPYLRIP